MAIRHRGALSIFFYAVWFLAIAPWAVAGEQAERALKAVHALVASGEVKADAALRVAFKPGNINALLGPELELQKDWERLTGIRVTAKVIPQQPALIILKDNPEIDLTVARTHEFPDLLDQKRVVDLTPLLKRFSFGLPDGLPSGFVRPRLQGYLGDQLVAIPADGDVTIFYLRKDFLDDPKEQSAFRAAHGRELSIPETWEDYEQLIAFFHRPAQEFYGAAEERSPNGGWMLWMPRYFDQSAPYRPLFDRSMRPLIDSPEGIAATESYVRTVAHSPPEILGEGKDYSYILPMFMQGKAFSVVSTIAGAKLFNSPGSAVRGKFVAVSIPGKKVGGQLIRHNMPIYGNNLVVSSLSTQQALAFLFTMWLTDPDNSLRTVGVRGGHTDPYRWHHLGDQRIVDLYTAETLKVFSRQWDIALPPGTGVPGDGEYLAVLDRNLWLAASGRISAARAMKGTATEWEKITEQRGRNRQIRLQRIFGTGFLVPKGVTNVPSTP